MAAYDRILVEITDHVGTITLNRAEKANAFDPDMCEDLLEALRMLASADAVRVIVITGAGKAFCAGADLGVLGTQGDQLVKAGKDIALTIRHAPKPVLAAVNGAAAGGGANLALACDIVIASSDASFIQSFAKIGVIPDSGGTFILPRIVGLQRATALTMLAEKVSAEQALAWGMIYRVVELPGLAEAAWTTAAYLATQPTRGLGLIKRAFNRSLGVDLDRQLDYEEELQREAGRTADYAEGVRAFLEKRKPRFEGR